MVHLCAVGGALVLRYSKVAADKHIWVSIWPLNSPRTGNLGLWPGMGTKFNSGADGHLIQGLAISTVGFGWACP